MNPSVDPSLCPLCGGPNGCHLCTTDANKGPCWCTEVTIPRELLERVPEELRNRACICRECITKFHRE
ncbi:MAG: cysteine-rich CWC family protein [Chthoniobacteraceae bacterium]